MILAGGIPLRAFAAGDLYLHDWDERYHALVAKHLVEHPFRPTLYETPFLPYDGQDWMSNHVWLHKEPLALWLAALSMAAFGINVLALRLPSVLLSALAVGMTYRIGRVVGGPRVAFVAALLHSINGFLIELAAGRVPSDHVDTLFIVLFEASVLIALDAPRPPSSQAASRPWLRAAALGAVLGLAGLAKSPFSLTIVAIWLPLALRPGARPWRDVALPVMIAFAAAAAVYLPWQIAIGTAFPDEARWERAYTFRHLTEAVEAHAGGPLYHLARVPRLFGELAWLSVAWFFFGLRKPPRDPARLALALWIAIPYVFFSLVATKMPAYVMVAAPALFIVIALHWWRLANIAKLARGRKRWAPILAMAFLLLLPARFCLERVKPLWGPDWHATWSPALERAARQVEGAPTVVFNAPRPIELMFASSAVAYSSLPTEEDLRRAEREGLRVAVLDDGRLPESVRRLPGVLFVPR